MAMMISAAAGEFSIGANEPLVTTSALASSPPQIASFSSDVMVLWQAPNGLFVRSYTVDEDGLLSSLSQNHTQISTPGTVGIRHPTLAATGNRFNAIWQGYRPNTTTLAWLSTTCDRLAQCKPNTLISTRDIDPLSAAAATGLHNSGMAVAWVDGNHILTQMFSDQLEPIGPPQQISRSEQDASHLQALDRQLRIAQLGNLPSYVVTWIDWPTELSGQVHARIVDTNSRLLTPSLSVLNITDDYSAHRITALPGLVGIKNGFAMFFADPLGIAVSRYDSKGVDTRRDQYFLVGGPTIDHTDFFGAGSLGLGFVALWGTEGSTLIAFTASDTGQWPDEQQNLSGLYTRVSRQLNLATTGQQVVAVWQALRPNTTLRHLVVRSFRRKMESPGEPSSTAGLSDQNLAALIGALAGALCLVTAATVTFVIRRKNRRRPPMYSHEGLRSRSVPPPVRRISVDSCETESYYEYESDPESDSPLHTAGTKSELPSPKPPAPAAHSTVIESGLLKSWQLKLYSESAQEKSLIRSLLPFGVHGMVIGYENGNVYQYFDEQLSESPKRKHTRAVIALCRLGEGHYVSSGDDRTIWMWGWHTGTALKRIAMPSFFKGSALEFTYAEGILAAGTTWGQVATWQVDGSDVALRTNWPDLHDDAVVGLELLQGKLVSASLDGGLSIDGQIVEELDEDISTMIRYAPSKVALACGDGKIRFFDAAKGEWLKKIDHGSPVDELAIMASGKLVSAAHDMSIKVWIPNQIITFEKLKEQEVSRPVKYLLPSTQDNITAVTDAGLEVVRTANADLVREMLPPISDDLLSKAVSSTARMSKSDQMSPSW